MENLLFNILFFLVLSANVASFWLKFDLKNHGYKTNLFWGHLRDIMNAREVMKTNEDEAVRKKYRIVLNTIAMAFISMSLFALNMFATKSERDKEFADQIFQSYLNMQYEGVIVSKYIDSSKYKRKMLSLEFDSAIENYRVSSFIYDNSKVGDYLIKTQKDSTSYLIQNTDTLKYTRHREDFSF